MVSRREFLEGLSAATTLALYPAATARLIEAASREAPRRLLPPALEKGMTVGIVAPSSPLFAPEGYRIAEEVVTSLGFRPRLAPHATDHHGYLAGSDRDRVADLNRFFADDAIDAIWCVRGGYGALRILPEVDFEVIRAHPKPFIGYSDITALHVAIGKLTGLVTFHGPMVSFGISEYALAEMSRVLFRKEPAGRVGAAPEFEGGPGRVETRHRVTAFHGGRARGPLVGGNLSLLTRLLGTPFEPDLEGRILFIEDIGEAAYRIDGMMSHLRLSGKLGACAGIVFGKFTDTKASQPRQLPVETVLRELTAGFDIPVLNGLMCGHLDDQTTLPYGVLAELDADAGTLALLEPAVR